MFDDYVGQLQMAAIATITIEQEGREITSQEIRAKLQPIQQACFDSSVTGFTWPLVGYQCVFQTCK